MLAVTAAFFHPAIAARRLFRPEWGFLDSFAYPGYR